MAPNGSLVLNMRATDSYKRRIAWSNDGGDAWSNSSNAMMPEFGGHCEGAMIRVAGKETMLMSSPFGIGPDWGHRCPGPGRCNMTVWQSTNSAANWCDPSSATSESPFSRKALRCCGRTIAYQLNESLGVNPREAAAYSAMAQLNSSHFGLIYERDNAAHLTLAFLPFPS